MSMMPGIRRAPACSRRALIRMWCSLDWQWRGIEMATEFVRQVHSPRPVFRHPNWADPCSPAHAEAFRVSSKPCASACTHSVKPGFADQASTRLASVLLNIRAAGEAWRVLRTRAGVAPQA